MSIPILSNALHIMAGRNFQVGYWRPVLHTRNWSCESKTLAIWEIWIKDSVERGLQYPNRRYKMSVFIQQHGKRYLKRAHADLGTTHSIVSNLFIKPLDIMSLNEYDSTSFTGTSLCSMTCLIAIMYGQQVRLQCLALDHLIWWVCFSNLKKREHL